MPKISVIVPVYNVEKYIHQCIDSILDQSFSNFELVLVDDGSPDNCGNICDKYSLKDNRIVVIHRENGGLSAARNSGIDWVIENSNSSYITFIDSDDWVNKNYLEQLLFAVCDGDADISICGICSFSDGDTVNAQCKYMSPRYLSGRKTCLEYYHLNWTVPIAACAKLYKKDLFQDIRFPEGKVYEDQGTVPRLWFCANNVALITDCELYNYRTVPTSISHREFSCRKFEDVWNVEHCRKFFAEKGDQELEQLCARFRDILQAKYIVLAHHFQVADQIPPEYFMGLHKALRLLRREVSDYTYSWYLSQVYPRWVKPHSYFVKIKNELGTLKKGSNL